MKYLTTREVCEKLKVSRATLYRLRDDSSFPEAVYVSARTPRWSERDIDDWLEQKRNRPTELRVRPELLIGGTPRPPRDRRLSREQAQQAA